MFVEPPVAQALAKAFSNEARVRMSLGYSPRLNWSITSLPALKPICCFAGSVLRHGGHADRRETQNLDGRRHRVGGELPAARAGAWTGRMFQFGKLGVGHAAARVRADAFEDIDNGDVAPLKTTGLDRAAVQNKAGDIEPNERHCGSRQCLVAGGQDDDGVEHVAAPDKLD